MTIITRRAALRGIASLPAIGVATAALAVPDPETPVSKVGRIAEELSHAMDAWMADLEATNPAGGYSHWIAHVHPASFAEYPIMFENSKGARISSPAARLECARKEFINATKAMYPEVTDWRWKHWEEKAPQDHRGMFVLCPIGGTKS